MKILASASLAVVSLVSACVGAMPLSILEAKIDRWVEVQL